MYNRRTASHEPEESDVVVPTTVRLVFPPLWWICPASRYDRLSPPKPYPPDLALGADSAHRTNLCGWLSVIGTLSLVISFDSRWTGWRASLQGICIAYISSSLPPFEPVRFQDRHHQLVHLGHGSDANLDLFLLYPHGS